MAHSPSARPVPRAEGRAVPWLKATPVAAARQTVAVDAYPRAAWPANAGNAAFGNASAATGPAGACGRVPGQVAGTEDERASGERTRAIPGGRVASLMFV
jgi:hypothetical protein